MGRRTKLGLALALLAVAPGCIEEHPDFVFATESGSSGSGGSTSTSGAVDTTSSGTTSPGTGDGDSGSSSGTGDCTEELCNGVDDDCDDEIDEGCDCIDGQTEACFTGDPALEGVGECQAGTRECTDGQWGACEGEVLPAAEECNSLDDDCDDEVDEDFGQVECGLGICMVTVDVCVDGTPQQCTPGMPLPDELCNGFDDDCDGRIDEIMCECLDGQMQACYSGPMGTDGVGICVMGTQECVNGAWDVCVGDQTPLPEACNGLDDNCDGAVDDGDPGGGGACATGVPGLCAQGVQACVGGMIECQQTVLPEMEICDGFDNDCDTGVDEGNPEGGQACSTGLLGECDSGQTLCQGGALSCNQAVFPQAEQCNMLDDDCDGATDEGNPESGQACSTGLPGACDAGTTNCNAGVLECSQVVFPLPESCDGVDEDCDGVIDNGAVGGGLPCPTGLPGECGTGVSDCSGGMATCDQTVFPVPEVCNGLDDDCDGMVDEGNPGSGGACVTGQPGVCTDGTEQCTGGMIVCEPDTPASAEVCNGLDDDCDGVTDDGDPGGGQACSTGQPGVCDPGTTACTGGAIVCNQDVAAGAEVCNGLDDDCDGAADDGDPGGGQACSTGLPGICDPGTTTCTGGAIQCNQNAMAGVESCNGLDDDCDGPVDEGNPGGGMACNTGQAGVCAAGTTACSGGGIVCNANQAPVPELCDGLDNDCDGVVDEGDPGGGGACNTGQPGVCAAGTEVCSGGVLVCSPNMGAGAEVCDGLDNDCDGVVDEGNPGGGGNCNTGQPGVCGPGTTTCAGGMLVCNQNAMAGAEVCDGLDNDCDGAVDDGNPGGGMACITGLPGVCSPGTTTCSGGAIQCTPNAMAGAEVCDGLDNDCNALVDDGNPGGGMACSTGQPGVCDAGTTTCSGGMLVCGQSVMAGAEQCNGLDDDCDGISDEGDPGGGQACSTGLPGICDPGTTACSGGAIVCNQNAAAGMETCNGLDDDCDGGVDDGDPGGGQLCSTGLPGACDQGLTQCSGGGIVCSQAVFPVMEICGNAIDDDCDGTVDNGCGFGFDNGYTGYEFQGMPLPCDDISATGIATGLFDDDFLVVPIGFTFPVYGVDFNNVTIQSNGALHFDSATELDYLNDCLPSITAPTTNNVYVFWDDLNPSELGSEVYYQTLGVAGSQRLVVQWDTAHFSGDTIDIIRVQAMLDEATGIIDVCYPDTLSAGNLGDNGAEATAGIQQDSANALQFSCNTPDLTPGTWLQYVPF